MERRRKAHDSSRHRHARLAIVFSPPMLTQRPAGRPIRPRSPRPASWCVIFGSGSAAEISRVPSVPKRIPAANDSIQRLPDVDAGLDRTRSTRLSPKRQTPKGRGIRKGSWTSYGEANRRDSGRCLSRHSVNLLILLTPLTFAVFAIFARDLPPGWRWPSAPLEIHPFEIATHFFATP